MLGFLILHIAALLFWAAGLLYLPAVISGSSDRRRSLAGGEVKDVEIARFLFTRIATPAALIAIVAGTGVFVLNKTVDAWLIVKLTLVTGLVITHGGLGFLIVRAESHSEKSIAVWCWLSAAITTLLMTGIILIVLGKPEVGNWM
ncbi:CopD family protein [Allohahella marinimesophila]